MTSPSAGFDVDAARAQLAREPLVAPVLRDDREPLLLTLADQEIRQHRLPVPVELRPREQLVERLNDDLSREYQAIIAYVVYSRSSRARST